MQEANLTVNDVLKQHCGQPTNDSHSTINSNTGLKTQLKLDGTFPGLCSREPADDDLNNGIHVPTTPEGISWSPNSLHFAVSGAVAENVEMQRIISYPG